MVSILTRLILFYQCSSRFLLPKACRFYPSCSQYAIEALNKWGCLKGLWMAVHRIIRCSPLSKGGYDPVR